LWSRGLRVNMGWLRCSHMDSIMCVMCGILAHSLTCSEHIILLWNCCAIYLHSVTSLRWSLSCDVTLYKVSVSRHTSPAGIMMITALYRLTLLANVKNFQIYKLQNWALIFALFTGLAYWLIYRTDVLKVLKCFFIFHVNVIISIFVKEINYN